LIYIPADTASTKLPAGGGRLALTLA